MKAENEINVNVKQTFEISIENEQAVSVEELKTLIKLYLYVPPKDRKSYVFGILSGMVLASRPDLSKTLQSLMRGI